jgi:hypothetical protein
MRGKSTLRPHLEDVLIRVEVKSNAVALNGQDLTIDRHDPITP